jgi:hypothetical protein
MPTPTQGQSGFSRALIEKIRTLSPERIAEIEDFVDFLRASWSVICRGKKPAGC